MNAPLRKTLVCLAVFIFLSPVLTTAQQRSSNKFFSTGTRLITGLYFTDPQHGWAITDHDTLLYTEDGGQNWKVHPQKFSFYELNRIYFTDKGLGWIFPDYRTTDNGRTWTKFRLEQDEKDVDLFYPSTPLPSPRPKKDPTGAKLKDEKAKRPSVIIRKDEVEIIMRMDSTASTSSEPSPPEEPRTSHGYFTINRVHFLNNQYGWVSGYIRSPKRKSNSEVYTFLETIDGGRSWRVVREIRREDSWWPIRFSDPQNGWSIGSDDLYRTTDGGKTWEKRTISKLESHKVGAPIHVVPISADVCLVVTAYRNVFRTTDGGQNLQLATFVNAPQHTGDPFKTLRTFKELKMVNEGEGWLLEEDLDLKVTALYYTSDCGQTWKYTGSIHGAQLHAFFLDRQRGWLFGYHNETFSQFLWHGSRKSSYGIIAHTDDAGRTWRSQKVAEDEIPKLKDRRQPDQP